MKITSKLNTKTLISAADSIDKYADDLHKKAEYIRERVTEELTKQARINFGDSVSEYQRLAKDKNAAFEADKATVTVDARNDGNISIVFAYGAEVLFVEFGAGVWLNGGGNSSAGSSPHPKGVELGMTIGGYGKGYGQRKVWGFVGEDGQKHLSVGTPSQMPMWNAVISIVDKIPEIARSAFR